MPALEQEQEQEHVCVGPKQMEVVLDTNEQNGKLMCWVRCDDDEIRVAWTAKRENVDLNWMVATYGFPRSFLESGAGHVHIPMRPLHKSLASADRHGVVLKCTCGTLTVVSKRMATESDVLVTYKTTSA